MRWLVLVVALGAGCRGGDKPAPKPDDAAVIYDVPSDPHLDELEAQVAALDAQREALDRQLDALDRELDAAIQAIDAATTPAEVEAGKARVAAVRAKAVELRRAQADLAAQRDAVRRAPRPDCARNPLACGPAQK